MAYYLLDKNKKVTPCTMQQWIASERRYGNRVARNVIGDYDISTVFLGIDHSFGYCEEPLLFETMIFAAAHLANDCKLDGYQTRCSTYEQALEMHQHAIERVKSELKTEQEAQDSQEKQE